MKKYLFGIILFLIGANISFAGPFELFNQNDTVRSVLFVDGDGELVGEELEAYAQVRNTSSAEVEFSIKMRFLELTSGHSAALCWGECFLFTDTEFISPWTFKLKPNEESKIAQFSGHLLPYKLLSENPIVYSKSKAGTTVVRYIFAPVGGNTDDELIYDVVFIVDAPTSVYNDPSFTISGVYPNPSSDFLRIELGAEINSESVISVLDLSGRQISEQRINSGIKSQTIDISKLATGNYYLTILNGNKITSKKFNVIR
jgi:hypothetical protein